MRYMLWLYDNADTRDAFFGPGSETLGREVDAVLPELRDSGELIATAPLADVPRPRPSGSAATPPWYPTGRWPRPRSISAAI